MVFCLRTHHLPQIKKDTVVWGIYTYAQLNSDFKTLDKRSCKVNNLCKSCMLNWMSIVLLFNATFSSINFGYIVAVFIKRSLILSCGVSIYAPNYSTCIYE
jgi:hypothetical protein